MDGSNSLELSWHWTCPELSLSLFKNFEFYEDEMVEEERFSLLSVLRTIQVFVPCESA